MLYLTVPRSEVIRTRSYHACNPPCHFDPFASKDNTFTVNVVSCLSPGPPEKAIHILIWEDRRDVIQLTESLRVCEMHIQLLSRKCLSSSLSSNISINSTHCRIGRSYYLASSFPLSHTPLILHAYSLTCLPGESCGIRKSS